jgi:hypothetical protein
LLLVPDDERAARLRVEGEPGVSRGACSSANEVASTIASTARIDRSLAEPGFTSIQQPVDMQIRVDLPSAALAPNSE